MILEHRYPITQIEQYYLDHVDKLAKFAARVMSSMRQPLGFDPKADSSIVVAYYFDKLSETNPTVFDDAEIKKGVRNAAKAWVDKALSEEAALFTDGTRYRRTQLEMEQDERSPDETDIQERQFMFDGKKRHGVTLMENYTEHNEDGSIRERGLEDELVEDYSATGILPETKTVLRTKSIHSASTQIFGMEADYLNQDHRMDILISRLVEKDSFKNINKDLGITDAQNRLETTLRYLRRNASKGKYDGTPLATAIALWNDRIDNDDLMDELEETQSEMMNLQSQQSIRTQLGI